MKKPIELAARFLNLAEQDIKTFNVLVELDDIADSQVGFHAQQAVEKCLKAVLVFFEVEFRKTHDITELLDLLVKNQIELPPFADEIDELNPFAVALRYDLFDTSNLHRDVVKEIVKGIYSWAQTRLTK